jgi:ABC-type branched-subunit amino acid transport system ATPase component
MRMEATIEVTGLRKRSGPAAALDGLWFTVPPGRVTGLAGPDGAGKSTMMRVIPGLDAADAGSAFRRDRPAGRWLPWPGDRTLGTIRPLQARTRQATFPWLPRSRCRTSVGRSTNP